MNSWVNDVIAVQKMYGELGKTVPFTKLNMCKAVVWFRDKYQLKDSDALRIARKETDLEEIDKLLEVDHDIRRKEEED